MVYLSRLKTWNSILKSPLSSLFLLLTLLASSSLTGQSREELEQKRYDIIQKIDDTNQLLQETAKNKKVLLSDLIIIETQIENRTELLRQVEQEIEFIDTDILSRAFRKEKKQRTVDSLKLQYNKVLRAVYRERALHNPLLALLSSKSVSQSFLKANVYTRLREHVAAKLTIIKKEQASLDQQIAVLSKDKEERRKVLKEVAEQSSLLENEQARQQVMMASLQEDESLLQRNLKEQHKNRERMNDEIEAILKSELRVADAEVDDDEAAENTAFRGMKGRMKWPVQGGVISGKYGKQPHPTMRNLTISNNGVDIRAPKNASVSSVYDGKVVSVSQMAGFGVTVIIDHGQYFTVYSRMAESTVANGDSVGKGQVLGSLEVKDDSSELHFEIWKDNKTQNPANWLQ